MRAKNYEKILNTLANMIGEGVHIVDSKGRNIVYNDAMARLEDVESKKVIGKHFDKMFGVIPKGESTIKKALENKKATILSEQVYKSANGKEIHTINTTMPIIENDKVIAVIEMASEPRKMVEGQVKEKEFEYSFDDIICQNHMMKKQLEVSKKASQTDISIIIQGDIGTGKELLAKIIHSESKRKDKSFISQRCRGMNEERLEEILFGVDRKDEGHKDFVGKIEEAKGGTLFLDELESISYELQGKILTALQRGFIRKKNGKENIGIDVRIICSIGENPERLIEKGLLKKELFYAVNGVKIHLPNLKDRKEDIIPLFNMFLEKECEKAGIKIPKLDKNARNKLINYEYQGNVRELENVVVSTLARLQDEDVIQEKDLIFTRFVKKDYSTIVGYDNDKESLYSFICNIERKIIWEAIERNKGNITQTASELGMKRQTLQHKLKKYGMEYK